MASEPLRDDLKNGALNDDRFRNKTIVVTGAGGNFGRAGCQFFAARGARVAAMDKNAATLEETMTSINKALNEMSGVGPVASFVCDVTDVESVENAVDQVEKKFGNIDLLWNNAGYQGNIEPTLEYSPKDFATVMNINVTGMFIVMQSVAKRMAASHADGENTIKVEDDKVEDDVSLPCKFSIVNTASVAAMRGTPAMVAYSASKAAVLAMTVSAAKDLAPHGIRVNAISPALIGPSDMWTRQNTLHANSGSPYFPRDPDEVGKAKINGVPMKRLGSVEEVVKSVAFLLSDDSSYTTAFNLVVDGGLSGGLR